MNQLVIEASGPEGSVAVTRGGELVGFWGFQSPRGRGGAMFPALEAAVKAGGPFGEVVVGTGPGGYNGLRMAMAAGWGIARAHGAKLFGVPSLLGYEAPDYFAAGDARGGRWFLARVADGRWVDAPVLLDLADLRQRLLPGVPVFISGSDAQELPGATCLAPRADVIARRPGAFGPPVPIYLKPPHITEPKPQPGAKP